MRCDQCPALVYGYQIDDEYFSACKLGYKQIKYKDNEDCTYCRKHLKTIENELYLLSLLKELKEGNTFTFNEIYEEVKKMRD